MAKVDTGRAVTLLPYVLPSYLLRFSLGPIPFTILEATMVGVAIGWALRAEFKLNREATVFAGALMLIAVISVIPAASTMAALGILKSYFVLPLLTFVIAVSTFKKEDIPNLLKSFYGVSILLSLYALFQYISGSGIPIPWDAERRVTSFFPYPNALGLFLAPIAAIGWHQLWTQRDWFAGIAALLSTIAMILSETEAGLVAVAATLLLLALRDAKKKLIPALLGALMMLTAALMPALRAKLLLQDYSGSVRLSQWSETLPMLIDRPILGAGLSGYPEAFAPYHTNMLFEIFQYPHNLFLNAWSELGLLGLIVTLAAAAYFAFKFIRGDKSLSLIGLTTIFIHGFVDVPFFKNDLAMLTLLLVASTLIELATSEASKPLSRSL
jgi:O-antigen ligase